MLNVEAVMESGARPGIQEPIVESIVTVAICIITCQRVDGLRRLVDSLGKLEFRDGRNPAVRLIVVDNDPLGSAIEVCSELARESRWPIEAKVESRRGIPFARNTALALAGDSVDFVAFIDDDEVPDSFWLDELLRVQRDYQADIVTGPVLPRFAQPLPRWLERGRFYDRPRTATGTRMRDARTGNVLIRGDVVRSLDEWFNERMALTGGSDTHFFRRVSQRGKSIVFADDAVVYETVPESRANAGWLLRREFRLGNALAFCERELDAAPWTLGRRALKGGARVMLGIGALPFVIIGSGPLVRTNILKTAKVIWRGAGMLAGLVGHKYEEYRKIHGS